MAVEHTISAEAGAPASQMRIGELLVARGAAGESDIEEALRIQAEFGGRLGEILVRTGAVDEDDLLDALSDQLELPVADPAALPEASEAGSAAAELGLAGSWLAVRRAVLWRDDDGKLACAARDPLDPALREALERKAGADGVRYYLAKARMLETLSGQVSDAEADAGLKNRLHDMAEEAPTVSYVDSILAEAARRRASDVHFEPEPGRFAVRFRIDGVLQTHAIETRPPFEAVSSRIKLICGMDIAERRLPQDGRMSRRIGGEKIDFRVSALPGAHGESVVLRLLRSESGELSLDELGIEADHAAMLRKLIHAPNGVVLVTGPTGSGKTTTLYAALREINDGERKIVTVEDPVEYEIPGITQVQVRSDIGYDFARALRAILRQDPDVILVGEIRDLETAKIAIQAALTGHLVLSTIHTNDAVSAVTRLRDMGVEPFLIAASVRGVIAQRLARRLDWDQSEPDSPPEAVAGSLPPGAARDFRRPAPGAGAKAFSGRIAAYEMAPVSPAMQSAIAESKPLNELRAIARREGMRSLREDALLKAGRGVTSVEEALRLGQEDDV